MMRSGGVLAMHCNIPINKCRISCPAATHSKEMIMSNDKFAGLARYSRAVLMAPMLAVAGGLALSFGGCVEIPLPTTVAPDGYFTPASGTTFTAEPAQISIVGLQGLAVCYTMTGRLPVFSNGNCAASNQELPDSGLLTLQKCGTNTVRLLWANSSGALFTTTANFFKVTPACDGDGDGVVTDSDNCPTTANADQADADGDGVGDVCDSVFNDADADGVGDALDNCPAVANADQANLDNDSTGDACDTDVDGDTILNDVDNCPTTFNFNQADTDADGIGDVCDAA
jgi:hypothetical protein